MFYSFISKGGLARNIYIYIYIIQYLRNVCSQKSEIQNNGSRT